MQELFNKLRPILQQKVPNIQELGTLRYELAEAKADALQKLLEARVARLRPKDKEWTDLDRKTEMEAMCAEYEHNYTFLCDLWTIVNDSIMLSRHD